MEVIRILKYLQGNYVMLIYLKISEILKNVTKHHIFGQFPDLAIFEIFSVIVTSTMMTSSEYLSLYRK